MTWKPGLFAAAALLLASCSSVHGVVSNDIGGIIPWSPENHAAMHAIAGERCARWHKRARITSVHARHGDYIGFVCFFPRGYDPVRDAGAIRTLN